MNNRKECKFAPTFVQNLFIFCFDFDLILHTCTFQNFFQKLFLFFFLFFFNLFSTLVNTIFVEHFIIIVLQQKHHHHRYPLSSRFWLNFVVAVCCVYCVCVCLFVCLCNRRSHKDCVFRYMGFPMVDAPTTDISRYFYVASKFIDSAISSGGK